MPVSSPALVRSLLLLSLPVPYWKHHRLITDENGKRLAKRDDARSLRALREMGWTPERIHDELGLLYS